MKIVVAGRNEEKAKLFAESINNNNIILDSSFKKKNILVVVGCGATPGITNIMAAYGSGFLDTIDFRHVQFADKDYTKYNMPFVVPYSIRTISEVATFPSSFKDKGIKNCSFKGGFPKEFVKNRFIPEKDRRKDVEFLRVELPPELCIDPEMFFGELAKAQNLSFLGLLSASER
ncbi:MAG: hypothetical protein J5U17_10435 [Candidatus Methanoperedens sp.]|nr:hypothetical protein [Candidatus Methanoperedens sp.]MCE8426179.1 hypothetical protein [Candidatus Methanoperedens sp.]MCE8429036.1 hypothetical protein [Candidatus Methanoperedens sp.]